VAVRRARLRLTDTISPFQFRVPRANGERPGWVDADMSELGSLVADDVPAVAVVAAVVVVVGVSSPLLPLTACVSSDTFRHLDISHRMVRVEKKGTIIN